MTTMQFEYDPERLIEEVKKRPGLWDFESVEYRTKAKRIRLWTDVVHELMTSDVKVTKSEMRELELQLQKKWKSIRDCFLKYVTHPERTRRPYIYSKQLQFLLQTRDQQQVVEASGESDDGQVKRRSWKPRKKIKISKDSSSEDCNDEGNDDHISNDSFDHVSNDVAKTNTPNKQNFVDEFAFANVETTRNEQEDPDKMFLLSLLPHLKSIPEAIRLNVKLNLMQVLRNANYGPVEDAYTDFKR